MDNSFSLRGKEFKLNKIDAMKQFHIARRLGPVLVDLIPALKDFRDVEKLSDNEKLEAIGKFMTPIMQGMSKLSDDEAEFVLYNLLSSVEFQQGSGNWARMSNGAVLMFQDFELPMLFQLAGKAFQFNLSGFTSALPQK